MRRLIVGVALLAALMVMLVAPISAAPAADFAGLAVHYPAGTQLYAAIRTDDGFIETLDALLARVETYLPNGAVDENLSEALDRISSDYPGEGDTFEEVFRPWLGSFAAFGIYNLDPVLDSKDDNDDDVVGLIAIQITSRQAALDFLDGAGMNDDDDVTIEETEVGTVITSDDADNDLTQVVITDSTMLFVINNAELNLAAETSLQSNAQFNESLALLPEPDYNAVVYLDTAAIFRSAIATMNEDSDEIESMSGFGMMGMGGEAFLQTFETYADSIGGQVWGFTIRDGRSLTMDIAMSVDFSAFEAMGMNMTYGPIDPTFARFLPANTPLVIHGSNFGGVVMNSIMNAGAQFEMMGMGEAVDPEEASEQISGVIQMVTGLPLEDAFGWMDGDFALLLGVSPALGDISSPNDLMNLSTLPVDFGFVIEATSNPENAARFADGITNAITLALGSNDNATVTEETIEGVEATVVTVTDPNTPFPIEFVIGASSEVFVLGTRDVAEAAFSGAGGLDSDPYFIEALSYGLPNTASLAYASGNGLLPIAALGEAMGGDEDDVANVRAVFELLSSSSITVTTDNASSYTARAVITLP